MSDEDREWLWGAMLGIAGVAAAWAWLAAA
jgi:hypothetical protein